MAPKKRGPVGPVVLKPRPGVVGPLRTLPPDDLDPVTDAQTLPLAVAALDEGLDPDPDIVALAERLERHGPAGYSWQSCLHLARELQAGGNAR